MRRARAVGQHAASAHLHAGHAHAPAEAAAAADRVIPHAGCGHSRVSEQSRFWSELHRESLSRARELGVQIGPRAGGSFGAGGGEQGSSWQDGDGDGSSSAGWQSPLSLGARGLLQADRAAPGATLPIRIWVEYQGSDSLPVKEQQKLTSTVNITLGVLHKYLRVRRGPGGAARLRQGSSCAGPSAQRAHA